MLTTTVPELLRVTNAEKILMVEDDIVADGLIVDVIQSVGYEVVAACDGASAIRATWEANPA
jgi:CheY-like chemotaxis protein